MTGAGGQSTQPDAHKHRRTPFALMRSIVAHVAPLLLTFLECARSPGVSKEVKASLRTIYDVMDGKSWSKNDNWLEYDPCTNKWRGVHCDKLRTDMHHVIGLNLFNNSIQGTLPTQLGLLTSLTALALRVNAISGTLPTELGLLTGLTALSTYNNRLSGTVPTELAALSPNLCWLNEAQCRTELTEGSCFVNEHRTNFRCPVPRDGKSPCVSALGLDCKEEL